MDRFSYDGAYKGSSVNPNTRGQTLAGGTLTVVGHKYGPAGAALADDDPDEGTDSSDNAFTTNTVNTAKYETHKIDLAAALDGGLKWSNGAKHVNSAKAVIEKQLKILESDIGLSAATKTTAWVAIQNAIANSLFKDAVSALPGTLGNAYSANSNADFVRAATEALEALQSNAALKAALGSQGVFDGLSSDTQKNVDKLWGRQESRVQYAIGTTDFTRFGAWRRVTSPNAETDYVDRHEEGDGDGPNSLAYSQLAGTTYQGLTDPRYPKGARMTYEGSTIAVIGNAFFQGSVDIEVLWGSKVNPGTDPGSTDDDYDEIGADLKMTIGDLENMANASPLYIDRDVRWEQNATDDDLEAVVSIVISAIGVDATLGVAANDTTTVNVNSVQSRQIAPRPTAWTIGSNDRPDLVKGQFVGQGVSGPLAVLGIYEFANRSGNAAIGAKVTGKAADKETVNRWSVTGMTFVPNKAPSVGDYFGVPSNPDDIPNSTFTPFQVHGGFGAELP